MDPQLTLALDLVGSNPDNLKVNDYPINNSLDPNTASLFVPLHGPFHAEGHKVVLKNTGTELAPGVDYYLTYYSRHANVNYGVVAYSGIVLTNLSLVGELELTTQHLGGGYTRYNPTIIPEVVSTEGEQTQVFWDDLVDAPNKAHPTDHTLPAGNIATGYEDMVAVLHSVSKQVTILATNSELESGLQEQIDANKQAIDELELNGGGLNPANEQRVQDLEAATAENAENIRKNGILAMAGLFTHGRA